MTYEDFEQRLRSETKASLESIDVPHMPVLRARSTRPDLLATLAVLLLTALWLPTNQAVATGIIAMTSTLKMIVNDAFGHRQELSGENISLQQSLQLRDVAVIPPRGLPVDAALANITHFGDPRHATVIFQYQTHSALLTIVEEPAATSPPSGSPMMIQYFNRNGMKPAATDFQIRLTPVTFVRASTRVTVISPDANVARSVADAMR
jgi:hypothetical protein